MVINDTEACSAQSEVVQEGRLCHPSPACWPSGKASASRAADLGSIPAFPVVFLFVCLFVFVVLFCFVLFCCCCCCCLFSFVVVVFLFFARVESYQ